MAEATVTIADVRGIKTQSGNTRFVVRDDSGREYTTFREAIARDAIAAEGHGARITFHEEQRGRFTNVYLDSVELLDDNTTSDGDEQIEEVAWKTAVDAAPWLLGRDADEPVSPDELYERLRPFKQHVADDIRGDDDDGEPE
jgi:hypothetical protein